MERLKKLIEPAGKFNLHSHTTYCDGKNTAEEMVLRAIELDFKLLGFSGHAYAPHDLDCCMTAEGEGQYREEVLSLKTRYRDRLDIRLGVERDFYSAQSLAESTAPKPASFDYDYEIGSVHYLYRDGVYLSVDDTSEIMEHAIEEHFNGRARDYVEEYFATEARVLEVTHADVVGHFDLVCKFNENNRYFDENAAWYRDCASAALEQLANYEASPRRGISDLLPSGKPVIEINMGGMAKGYRSRPYPDSFLRRRIQDLGFPIVLSSDCHNAKYLDYGFMDFAPALF